MSLRPEIDSLPSDLLAELDRKLIEGGFSDYRGLSNWLQERGYQISKDQVNRYASRIHKSILNARQQALNLAEMSRFLGDDDRGNLVALACDIGLLKSIEAIDSLADEDIKGLADLNRSIGSLGRTSLEQKKWNLISAAELEQRLKQIETDESTRDIPSSPEELISRIRQTVLGISTLAPVKAIEVEVID